MNICGVDEAGRGPLAGSIYASAVILNSNLSIESLTDSKLLSPSVRNYLFDEIREKCLAYAISFATVEEIEELNILNATLLAMKRAIQSLTIVPDLVLIDGNKAPSLEVPSKTIVKGDLLIPEISAASIMAKVCRDREMIALDKLYPNYNFAKHKGYGTKEHIKAIETYGLSKIHRKSFCKKIKINV
jgi:ribonuclease HII